MTSAEIVLVWSNICEESRDWIQFTVCCFLSAPVQQRHGPLGYNVTSVGEESVDSQPVVFLKCCHRRCQVIY